MKFTYLISPSTAVPEPSTTSLPGIAFAAVGILASRWLRSDK
jgi:hypothetical protein